MTINEPKPVAKPGGDWSGDDDATSDRSQARLKTQVQIEGQQQVQERRTEQEREQGSELARTQAEATVLRVSESGWDCLEAILNPAGLRIERVSLGAVIPGSHWGDEEAGLIKHTLYARSDTPVHSVLHEACHWLMMNDERREALHTDAKGSAVEEMAVCYLQILLADLLPCMGKFRMLKDMDAWGYSFRSGSSVAWFDNDADDALAYLTEKLPHADRIPGLQIHSP